MRSSSTSRPVRSGVVQAPALPRPSSSRCGAGWNRPATGTSRGTAAVESRIDGQRAWHTLSRGPAVPAASRTLTSPVTWRGVSSPEVARQGPAREVTMSRPVLGYRARDRVRARDVEPDAGTTRPISSVISSGLRTVGCTRARRRRRGELVGDVHADEAHAAGDQDHACLLWDGRPHSGAGTTAGVDDRLVELCPAVRGCRGRLLYSDLTARHQVDRGAGPRPMAAIARPDGAVAVPAPCRGQVLLEAHPFRQRRGGVFRIASEFVPTLRVAREHARA